MLACGRRWGKTLLLTRLAIQKAADGGSVGWFAPTYKLLSDAFDEAARRIGQAGGVRRSERRIDLPTGGRIEYWTLEDEDAGRSRSYDLALIDEAGLAPKLVEQWTYGIRPTLADRRGRAWFAGTPKGRNGFWRLWLLGADPGEPDWAAIRMPTSANPHIPKDEIEAARAQMPDRAFRQEFLAEFVEDGGGVFQGIGACVRFSAPPEPIGPVTVGVDLARLEDWTVCSAFDSELRQVGLDRFHRLPWAAQVERIAEFCRRFGEPSVVVDATGLGDPIAEALSFRGLKVEPFRITAQTKPALIDRLSLLISRGEVALLDDPTQTGELEAFEYQPLPGGGLRASAPPGMHDDTVMAMALALRPARPRPEWAIF